MRERPKWDEGKLDEPKGWGYNKTKFLAEISIAKDANFLCFILKPVKPSSLIFLIRLLTNNVLTIYLANTNQELLHIWTIMRASSLKIRSKTVHDNRISNCLKFRATELNVSSSQTFIEESSNGNLGNLQFIFQHDINTRGKEGLY